MAMLTQIEMSGMGLIGDSLVPIPYCVHLARTFNHPVLITGDYNVPIRPLLKRLPIWFDHNRYDTIVTTLKLNIHETWRHAHSTSWRLHFAQAFFAQHDQPIPTLPITLDLVSRPIGLPPGVVISPFSVSNSPGNNKFWPHQRWIEVIKDLRGAGLVETVYIVGSEKDDFSAYDEAGVDIVQGRCLTEILDLVRSSPLVMSVDNGIGHLCHFGGVSRHLMIYCATLAPLLNENPRGHMIRAPWPHDIYPAQVSAVAALILGR